MNPADKALSMKFHGWFKKKLGTKGEIENSQ